MSLSSSREELEYRHDAIAVERRNKSSSSFLRKEWSYLEEREEEFILGEDSKIHCPRDYFDRMIFSRFFFFFFLDERFKKFLLFGL